MWRRISETLETPYHWGYLDQWLRSIEIMTWCNWELLELPVIQSITVALQKDMGARWQSDRMTRIQEAKRFESPDLVYRHHRYAWFGELIPHNIPRVTHSNCLIKYFLMNLSYGEYPWFNILSPRRENPQLWLQAHPQTCRASSTRDRIEQQAHCSRLLAISQIDLRPDSESSP